MTAGTEKDAAFADLMRIPGVGKSIAQDLINIGYFRVADLAGESPEEMYLKCPCYNFLYSMGRLRNK